MKTKAEHSIIADAIHEWHTVYLPCIRNLSHNALKSYGEGMGIYIDFLESSKVTKYSERVGVSITRAEIPPIINI